RDRVHQRITKIDAASAQGRDDELTAGRADLFDELRNVRRRLAAEAKVPPFTIFHDATLREMCAKLPRTEEALLRIKGVGERKASKYGREFLECITAYDAKEK